MGYKCKGKGKGPRLGRDPARKMMSKKWRETRHRKCACGDQTSIHIIIKSSFKSCPTKKIRRARVKRERALILTAKTLQLRKETLALVLGSQTGPQNQRELKRMTLPTL